MQEHLGENRKKQESYAAALCELRQTVTPHHSPNGEKRTLLQRVLGSLGTVAFESAVRQLGDVAKRLYRILTKNLRCLFAQNQGQIS
jgi:hypothetical protein